MRIKIENSVIAVNEAHIFDEEYANILYCVTDNEIFKFDYYDEVVAHKALNKLFVFGYLEILDEECELYCSENIKE